MNRYRREFRQSLQTAVFWCAQFAVCAMASYAMSWEKHVILAIIFAVAAALQLLASMACVVDAWMWHRRDVATRNHYL